MDRRLHRGDERLGHLCGSAEGRCKLLVLLSTHSIIVWRLIDCAGGRGRRFKMAICERRSQECAGLATKYHAWIPTAIGINCLVPEKFRTVYSRDGKNKRGRYDSNIGCNG